jgi:hypothetical protein
MTTTNDPNVSPQDAQKIAEEALKVEMDNIFDDMLQKLFYFSFNRNGPLPVRMIGFGVVDRKTKTVLIPRDTPKDFLSLRRNTAAIKTRELIKRYYLENKQSTQLAKISETELENMLYERIQQVQFNTESPILKIEQLDDKEIKTRMSVLKSKADKINSAMQHYVFLRNSFLSILKGVHQDSERICAQYPDSQEFNEFFSTVKAILDTNLSSFNEVDYVK